MTRLTRASPPKGPRLGRCRTQPLPTPMQTVTSVPQTSDVLRVLANLIEYARDGQEGFRQAAEHAKAPELVEFFQECSQQRAGFVDELQGLERLLGQASPDDSGSMTGALHRAWIDIRTVVTKRDDQAILEEAERGEDAAVAAYRGALESESTPLPSNISNVIRAQAAIVKNTHDQVRDLRDSGRYQTATAGA